MLKDNDTFLRGIFLSLIISLQVFIILYNFVTIENEKNPQKPIKYVVHPIKISTFSNGAGTTQTYYEYRKFDLTEYQ